MSQMSPVQSGSQTHFCSLSSKWPWWQSGTVSVSLTMLLRDTVWIYTTYTDMLSECALWCRQTTFTLWLTVIPNPTRNLSHRHAIRVCSIMSTNYVHLGTDSYPPSNPEPSIQTCYQSVLNNVDKQRSPCDWQLSPFFPGTFHTDMLSECPLWCRQTTFTLWLTVIPHSTRNLPYRHAIRVCSIISTNNVHLVTDNRPPSNPEPSIQTCYQSVLYNVDKQRSLCDWQLSPIQPGTFHTDMLSECAL